MGLLGHGVRLLLPVLLVVLVLVGRPLLVLGSLTVLGPDRITIRRRPLVRADVPYSLVRLVETRRGLLLEWPLLYLRNGGAVELGAPVRLWFRADPEFDRDLEELRYAVGQRVFAEPYTLWSVPRLVGGPLLIAAVLTLILIDPPWASDAWPLRPHARRLPDACRLLDARARQLLPGATVDRAFSRSDDSGAYVKRHMCKWNATRPASDGAMAVDIGRLSIVLELDHGIGPVSDAEEAHRAFEREIHLAPGESGMRIPRTGDEAELITASGGPGYAWVTVAVRKANVEEKIDLICRERAREAAETAERLAKLGLAQIRFR